MRLPAFSWLANRPDNFCSIAEDESLSLKSKDAPLYFFFLGAKILAFVVAEGEILDVDHSATHVDPKGRPILSSRLEILEDLFDDVGAGRRMAVAHIAVEDSPVPLKDPLAALRKVLDLVIAAHKGDVDGQGVQNGLQFELSSGFHRFLIFVRIYSRFAPYIEITRM